MRNRQIIKPDEGVIGIDIGKYKHVAVAQRWDGRRLKPVVFGNNQDGFKRLWRYQEEAKEYLNVSSIRMALEPTGHYWTALAEWLKRNGISVEMVQPSHTHKIKEIEDNSPGKTDLKDAGLIAGLALQGKSLRLIMPQGLFAELRYLTTFRQELVRDLNREVNRLHRVMDVLFPELFGLFKKHLGKGLLALLREVPVPDKVLEMGEEGLGKLLSQHSRGNLGLKRALAIVEMARNSVGVQNGVMALEIELKQLLERIEFSKKQLKEIEKQIEAPLLRVTYVKVLLSIPQIGKITLATILGETGDLRGYQSAQQIIKLAGLNLYEISSGQQQGEKRITKRGRPLLRLILYMASLRLIKQKGCLSEFYQRLVGKGKPKMKAVIAVICKLLRVLFALVRDNRMFEESLIGNQASAVVSRVGLITKVVA